MKFTGKAAINQRIERITNQHAVVGIDIAKDVHAAQMIDFRGRELARRHLSFTNTREGFEKLVKWMHEVGSSHNKSSFLIGMEP
ncbi:IS110 family transposase, partial [Paenibacillus sp. IITD108]